MRVGEAFGKTMKASDLQGDLSLTIKGYKIENLGQGDDAEEKPVLYFHEANNGLALNVTNANIIAAMYGDEMDAWTEKRITLYPTTTEFSGKKVACIRVRERGQSATPQQSSAPAPGQGITPGTAWKIYMEGHKNLPADVVKSNFMKAVEAYFQGSYADVKAGITPQQWAQFVDDGWMRNPLDEAGTGIPADELPI
jgi:hypothetical protein